MVIKNADIYTEEGTFLPGDIYIRGKFFAASGDCEGEDMVIDGSGCYAIPGLTDIHLHGCAGYDFSDGSEEAIEAMAEYEASVGVTGMVPAAMTLGEEALLAVCRAAEAYNREAEIQDQAAGTYSRRDKIGDQAAGIYGRRDKIGDQAAETCGRARLYGIRMEGPFLAPGKKGAQNEACLRAPDIALYDRLQKASGNLIKLLDIAPETDGALELIEKRHRETIISLAHTEADYETAMQAFEKGASHVTHLYNAMNGYSHRAPGLVGAAADYESAWVELICDGVHVHPAAVRTTFKIFGEDRIIFVSDSMRATGLGDGDYSLGGQAVKVTGKRALLQDGVIAGSVTNLTDCMRRAVLEMGIPLTSAVKCAAVNPARRLGIYERCGSITPGKLANVLLLGKNDLEIRHVILEGKPVARKLSVL